MTKLRGTGEDNRDFWSKLPGFHWSATVSKTRPGSEVLAVHSNYVTEWGKMPILAIRQAGAGNRFIWAQTLHGDGVEEWKTNTTIVFGVRLFGGWLITDT